MVPLNCPLWRLVHKGSLQFVSITGRAVIIVQLGSCPGSLLADTGTTVGTEKQISLRRHNGTFSSIFDTMLLCLIDSDPADCKSGRLNPDPCCNMKTNGATQLPT
ncbi:hypothetical protein CEXT_375581 [Caerostris extrusa]|uniref:Uncharacterized protein n=1 Tax=Caerostris extrusa TaxID=172846 RepID=A0AAV4U332_CAEEX|nr:hypothetical protein CEXT_375581 [Caerostris extrusa]